jgi:hypothetical protein
MNYSDMYIDAEEFFKILRTAWENSEFFDGWDKKWHPEDLSSNVEAVFDGVVQTLIAYSNIVGMNVRNSKLNTVMDDLRKAQLNYPHDSPQWDNPRWTAYNSMEYANPERTQVFGGTVPTDQLNDVYSGDKV